MKNNNIIIIILLLVIFAGAAFFTGMKDQQKKPPPFADRFTDGQNLRDGNGQARFGNGIRPVNGEIIASDDKSITIKLQDGSSKIVFFSDTTQINKADAGTREDLKVGETLAVVGTDNSDGSVTAQNIQLNPVLRMGLPTPTPTQ